jgi:steroid delta-isomerase
MSFGPVAVLEAHIRRFNAAVGSGDFAEMARGFTADAQMVFEGVPVGPFLGRDAIVEAYARKPPDDEVRLLGTPQVEGAKVESAYGWAGDGCRAGRMIVTVRDGAIARLVVTFE